jgi:chemotaxis-related protein WspD
MTVGHSTTGNGAEAISPGQLAAAVDCWQRIGVSGDRSCPELEKFVHCHNCPVFAGAARDFFDRPAPPGYLAEWTHWLAETGGHGPCGEGEEQDHRVAVGGDDIASRESVSVLIFRLGAEWLALPTLAVAEVTSPRPVHRVPHRSNRIFAGLVSLQGRAELCVSLHGMLGLDTPTTSSSSRLIVLRDRDRAETWTFVADVVLGVYRPPRSQWRGVPSTLTNPAVAFSQAVLSWDGRTIGLLDDQRAFAAFRSLQP